MLWNAAQRLLDNYEDLTNVKNKLQRVDTKKLTYHEKAILRLMSSDEIKPMIRFVLEICSSAESMIKYLETNEFILFDVYAREKEFIVKWLSKVYDAKHIYRAFEDCELHDEQYLAVNKVQLLASVTKEKLSDQICNLKRGRKSKLSS